MMRKIVSGIVLALVLGLWHTAMAQQPYHGQVSFVPPGTPVSVTMNQTLSSQFTRVGETFTSNLSSPIYAGGSLVAPPGSQVMGQVVGVTPAGRGGKPGSIDLRLTNIVTPDGRRIPLSATIDRANFKLSANGGRGSHMAKHAAVGAGAGALSGLVGASISGGKKGKASAIGTGIGAGVGILGGAFKKGKDFVMASGSIVPFRLDTAIQAGGASAPVQRTSPEYSGGGFAPPAQPFAPPANPYGGAPAGGYQGQQPSNPYLYD